MATRSRIFTLHAGEIDDWAVGFSDRLDSGETLSGTPTVSIHDKDFTGAVYAGVTASQVGRNVNPLADEDGTEHAADEAVEFRVTAADDATEEEYWLRVECATTAGRSLVARFTLKLLGPPEA